MNRYKLSKNIRTKPPLQPSLIDAKKRQNLLFFNIQQCMFTTGDFYCEFQRYLQLKSA